MGILLSSIGWEILLSVGIMLFLYWFLYLLISFSLSVWGKVIFALIILVLFIQSFLLFSAKSVKGYVHDIAEVVMTQSDNFNNLIDKEQKEKLDFILRFIPVDEKITNITYSESLNLFITKAEDQINAYIWRRIFWMIGWIVFFIGYVCIFAERENRVMRASVRHRRDRTVVHRRRYRV